MSNFKTSKFMIKSIDDLEMLEQWMKDSRTALVNFHTIHKGKH